MPDVTICEQCEVEYDLAEGENYIDPENLRLIREWHERGHVGSVFPTLKTLDIEGMKALLKANGYVVLKAKSYRQTQERHAIAKAQARWADGERESTERWAQTTLHNEIRELMARCTFLYGMARAKGATVEELAAGHWPTTGINCPNGHDCQGDGHS